MHSLAAAVIEMCTLLLHLKAIYFLAAAQSEICTLMVSAQAVRTLLVPVQAIPSMLTPVIEVKSWWLPAVPIDLRWRHNQNLGLQVHMWSLYWISCERECSQQHDLFRKMLYSNKWNYMFRPVMTIMRYPQWLRWVYIICVRACWWPLQAETCSFIY